MVEVDAASIREDQLSVRAHLSYQKNIERITGPDSESAGLFVLVAVNPDKLQGEFAGQLKVRLPLGKKTECKIGVKHLSGSIGKRFIGVGNPPQRWLFWKIVDAHLRL